MIPLSHLSEYWYCPREMLYYLLQEDYHANENKDYTLGKIEHAKIDIPGERYKSGIHQIKQFEIYSERFEISGKLDMLEIKDGQPYPVELKKGQLRHSNQIMTQVKLQIIVLEEFLNIAVPYGYASFSQPHERLKVELDDVEKDKIITKILEIKENLRQPDPFKYFPRVNDRRCEKCSFHKNCYY